MSQEYRELTPEEISELLEFIKEKKSQKNKIQTSEEIKKAMQEIANILGIDINRIKYKIFVSKNQEIPEVCFSIESEDDNKKLELNVQERHLLFSLQYFLAFENCKFKTPFCNRISFQYFKPLNFKNCEFEQEVNFKNCEFKQRVNFSNCKFSENIYFNNSHFCEYADFHECDFEKVACFYGVDFKKAPNFSQAVFKGNLNLINAKLNFDFEDLKEKIKEEHKNNKEKPLENIANDFRDSFRIFKNTLIKDNNLLDASNFHRIELYCKEIELRESLNKKGIEAKSENDIRKNTNRVRDVVDSLLLGFYRKLSDHHTDFLRVFNNLIMLIALYTLSVFIGGYKINSNKTDTNLLDIYFFIEIKKNIINLSFIQQYHNYILIFFCLICLISLVIMLYRIFKNIKIDFKIIKDIDLKDMLKNLWNLFMYLLVLLCALIYLNIYIPKEQDNFSIISNIGIFFAFFIFYLWLVCLNSLLFRYFLIIFSYICVVIAIGVNVAILNPFIGKLPDDNPNNLATFAYTILMFLVLFSLQKTARKNSIVPS